jgi:hypothetical protein
VEDLDDLHLSDLEATLHGLGVPSGEEILAATDFKVFIPGHDDIQQSPLGDPQEHSQLRSLFSTWINTATPRQRRWSIVSATGGSNLSCRLTIKTAKDNDNPVYENMQGQELVFRTCEMTAVFA